MFRLIKGQFIHIRHDPMHEITIPSKTYGYLASDQSILVTAEDGELVSRVEKHHPGLACLPEDTTVLASAVRLFRNMPTEQLEKWEYTGLQAVSAYFSRTSLGNQYLNQFESVCNSFREGQN
jgi:colanic acid biosynthesis glycosyl transferase WcaI